MKRNRAISMILAAALSTGVAAVHIPVATAQETSAPTMAEQYQPVYSYKEARTDSYLILPVSYGLPSGTQFQVFQPNFPSWNPESYQDGPLVSSVHNGLGAGRVQINQPGDKLHRYGNEGYTTTVSILVTYPDGSAEIVTATGKITSSMSRLTTVKYAEALIEPGSAEVISPSIEGNDPEKYTLVHSEQYEAYRAQGWGFELDQATGRITVTAPDEADLAITLPLSIDFSDGSRTTVNAIIRSGFKPEPEPEPEPQPAPNPPSKKGGSSFGSSS